MTTQIEKLDGGIKQKDIVLFEITGENDFEISIKGNGTFKHKSNHLSVWSLLLTVEEKNFLLGILDDKGLSVKCVVQQSKTEMTKNYPTFSPFICENCPKCPLYWSLFIPKTQEELFLKGTSPCYIIREEAENTEALLKLSDNYRKHYDACSYFQSPDNLKNI